MILRSRFVTIYILLLPQLKADCTHSNGKIIRRPPNNAWNNGPPNNTWNNDGNNGRNGGSDGRHVADEGRLPQDSDNRGGGYMDTRGVRNAERVM